MPPALRLRLASLIFVTSASVVATASAVSACSDGSSSDPAAGVPDGSASSPSRDGASADDDGDDSDPSDPTKDAGAADAKSTKDANGPGAAGADCAFNRDCQAALRCECSEDTGCSCQPGARGTGRNGLDACDSGDQCASSLCVDGPTSGEMICSDECSGPSDCVGKLPKCVPIFGIPQPICARDPNQ